MDQEGKYIYCIIETEGDRRFGSIGIGERGDEVYTLGYHDLSMVVSHHPISKFNVSRENLLAHQKVIEQVMQEFKSVLPVRFGTVASNAEEIRNLLDRRYREFKSLLKDMDHKVELGVKGLWKNMDEIYKEILKEKVEVRKAKEIVLNGKGSKNIEAKIEVGKMVVQALENKKEEEAKKIVESLRKSALDCKLNKVLGDEMFMNASFLVSTGQEKEFDNLMQDLGEKYEKRVKFMYTGPFPIYNFVELVIYPEEWEK